MPVDFHDLLDYFEPPVSIGFDVKPEAALDFFYAKGLKKSFDYSDLSAREHANSFTIAKMTDMDMLGDVKASMEKALAEGIPFKQWKDGIMPTLQEKGWWGKSAAGQQLGSPWRLETIYRTNMQSAYAVGEWEQIREQEDVAPFLMYDAVDDFRTRPEHAAMDGTIRRVSDTFWKHYHPPNGYNCRCSVIQLSAEDMEELGLEESPPQKIETYNWTNPKTGKVEKVAVGTDPGFDFNPGEERYQQLQKIAQQKVGAMEADMAKAANEGLIKTQQEAAKLAQLEADAIRGAAKLSSASKAAERVAAATIEQALQNKTPYLSKAIELTKATKGSSSMTNTELLKVAQEKAAKLEQSTLLSEYKKAGVAGKKPSVKAQAAFDALPEEAQAALTEQINAQSKAALAEKAAATELAALVENPVSLPAKLLAKMDTAGKTSVQKLEELKAAVAAQKYKQVTGQHLAGYKKSVLAGKTPTLAQKDAFDTLTGAEQDKILSALADQKAAAEAAKVKPSAPPPPAAAIPTQRNVAPGALDPDDLVQTGPQGGSNPGGEFTDTSTGQKWYLKYPDNVEALRNEALANQLYALAGVEVPETRLIMFKGKPAIASRIIEGLQSDRAALTRGRVPGVQEHFGVDAWLSNWDVIGPDFANTKLNALGRGVRIDPGGALRFRAQGGMKGAAFGDDVLDLESLRDSGTNPATAAVFKHATKADIEDSVRRILAIPDEKLAKALDDFGPLDLKERAALLAKLKARREYLAKKYSGARPQAPEGLADARVLEADQRAIVAARGNGTTLLTDSDVIEDHHVVVTTLTDKDGKPKTRMTMKLRPEAGKKLQRTMSISKDTAPVLLELGPLKTQALEFLKGVGALAKKGEVIRDKDIARLGTTMAQLLNALDKLKDPAVFGDAAAALATRRDLIRLKDMLTGWAKDAKLGQKAVALENFDVGALPDSMFGPIPKNEVKGLPWKQTRNFSYQLADIERGHIREKAGTETIPMVGDVREVTIDGQRVRYIPYGQSNSITSEGYLQIDLDGVGIDVTRKAFKVLDELKIPTTRPGELDRLDLYLERIAALRTLRNQTLTKDLAAIRQIKDQASRTEEMLLALNKDVGFDMRTSPNWNPQGVQQAFGHGRTLAYRPDLKASDIADFEKKYLVYTNPTGLSVGGHGVWESLRKILDSGGQFASQMDRVRRGIVSGGSSVSSDHRTGSANYIFTRLVSRSRLTDSKAAGVYWRGRQVARLDAFSYSSDEFGAVSRSTQENGRAKTIEELTRNARGGGNETNFRDSISVFDDVEKIVLNNRTDYEAALAWFRANGYSTWPDGRKLEDVLDYVGKR